MSEASPNYYNLRQNQRDAVKAYDLTVSRERGNGYKKSDAVKVKKAIADVMTADRAMSAHVAKEGI